MPFRYRISMHRLAAPSRPKIAAGAKEAAYPFNAIVTTMATMASESSGRKVRRAPASA